MNLSRSVIASRANLVPARIALESMSSLLEMTSVMLGYFASTTDLMKGPAESRDTVERKRMRQARKMRSGEVVLWQAAKHDVGKEIRGY